LILSGFQWKYFLFPLLFSLKQSLRGMIFFFPKWINASFSLFGKFSGAIILSKKFHFSMWRLFDAYIKLFILPDLQLLFYVPVSG